MRVAYIAIWEGPGGFFTQPVVWDTTQKLLRPADRGPNTFVDFVGPAVKAGTPGEAIQSFYESGIGGEMMKATTREEVYRTLEGTSFEKKQY